MIGSILKKVFGTRNERVLTGLAPLVRRVGELEKGLIGLSDEALARKTIEFKERIERGATVNELEPEAFAVTREASKRVLGMRHFDVQLIGGAVLHRGMISEMRTGEGKTLVATLPAYLNALKGEGVHVVTVNDYLAKRDSEWMGRLYNFLGLSVGVVVAGRQKDSQKKEAYNADITYGQNNEFGFDYLRDNMKLSLSDQMQRGHAFAIVDEVDSILIDEARTPLIISGPAEEATDKYYKINKIIPFLEKEKHFDVDVKTKQPTLTEKGIARCEELLSIDNLYDPRNIELVHHIAQALKAHTTLERDKDYVVKDGKVIIVDEFTGRLMDGRRWSNGLHQATEAKEGLSVARENITLASITFQNYFRLYKKLAGMTGTADTEAVEFKKIYNLDVVVIPTNRPLIRRDESDLIYRSRKEKYEAVVNDIKEIHSSGQPVLVGTVSIEQSESLSKMLERNKIPHNVLNAKHHEREAEIVAQGGRYGAVTIATNMAGRGTDIILGGNPEFLAQAQVKDKTSEEFRLALTKFKLQCQEEKEKVLAAGGLFIMGTERHESRRIDNQLRGRSGRQGDPGVSRFYISLEDDLMSRFGGERFRALVARMGWEEGEALEGRMVSNAIEKAQKRVEAYHFEARKNVIEYDDVLNKQRQAVYGLRSRILTGAPIIDETKEMLIDIVEEYVLRTCPEGAKPLEYDTESLLNQISQLCNTSMTLSEGAIDIQRIFDELKLKALTAFESRVIHQQMRLDGLKKATEHQEISLHTYNYEEVLKNALLENLDKFWNLHLQDMEDLREGIYLRGYGQKNPLYEYQKEGFILFQTMLLEFKQALLKELFFAEFIDEQSLIAALEEEKRRREALEAHMKTHHESVLEDSDGDGDEALSPDDMRAKLEAAKKLKKKLKR